MDVTVTPKPDTSQVQLDVTVTAEEFEQYVDQAAKKLSADKPLKGFRPGKAPAKVVIEAFGTERVISEALEKGLPRFFVQAVLEHDIEALGRPATTIKEASLENGVVFEAIVDVLPEVELGDVSAISVEQRSVEVPQKDVDRELTYLAKSRSTYLDVARPAEKGDTVVVDFSVTMNGELMSGGEGKQQQVHLGEGHFIPDFETKIQGMTAGDTREFEMTFPKDFPNEKLREKKANATVQVHQVQKRVVPELNDDFAKQLGSFSNLKDLKTKLSENLKQERQKREEERLHGELMEQLSHVATYPALPASLIEREIDRRIEELNNMLVLQQRTLEQYLKSQNKTAEQLREELHEPAERTVKVSLAMRQFAQTHNIEADDKEVEEKLAAYLEQYGSADKAKEQKLDTDELKANIASHVRNQRAIEALKEQVTIKEAAATS